MNFEWREREDLAGCPIELSAWDEVRGVMLIVDSVEDISRARSMAHERLAMWAAREAQAYSG